MAEANLQSLLKECDVQLYDDEIVKENGKTIYRVYITKNEGITLDDCEKVSRLLSPIFDVMPPVSGDWTLEVSSPGLERKLIKPSHFKSSINEYAKFELNNQEKIKVKILKFFDEKESILCVIINENSKNKDEILEEKEFLLSDIKKAKTYIKW